MKLGSLFDGSGGFPLSGALCGVEPCWAAEVEPYPIAVTRSRFPNMKHLGDVSKVDGGTVEPVDIITFGSPCQDLSVAGKRAGLKHTDNGDEETTRSGLFMEAVRIIKEMREATHGMYPTFAIWENVPGAFSSNKGEDFRVVLEELIKIVEPTASMPPIGKDGWPYSDCYMGDGWSLAYRTFDAQYWGVPQRRRRIYLVLDLGGERAGKILFEREGLRGYFTESGAPWKATAAGAERSPGADDCAGIDGYNSCLTGDKAAILGVNCGVSTGRNGVMVPQPIGINGQVAGTLDASYYKGCGMRQGVEREVVVEPVVAGTFQNTGIGWWNESDVGATIRTPCGGDSTLANVVCVATQQGGAEITTNGICPTITAAAGMSGNNQPWICAEDAPAYTMQDREGKPGGGKGFLIQEDRATSLRTSNYQYLFQPVVDANILDDQGGQQIGVRTDGKSPTLRAEMHGNVPCVMQAAGFKAGQSMAGGIGWQEECAATLSAQCSGTEPTVCIKAAGFCPEQGAKTRGIGYEEETSPTLRAGVTPAVVCETLPFDTTQVTSPQNGCNPQWGDPCHPLAAQGHPPTVCAVLASSAVNAEITDGSISPCLMARAGTGGNQLPLVAQKIYDARGNGDGETVPTLTGDHENRVTDYTAVLCEPMLASGKNVTGCLMASGYEKLGAQEMFSGDYTVVEKKPVFCLQGNGIDRADTAGCNGKGWKEDVSYTLNTIDRPAVAFAMQGFGDYTDGNVASGLKARDYKDATDLVCECAGVDCRNATENPESTGTLQHDCFKNLNSNSVVRVRYIVRRLTPTECARLQGFPDTWGHPDPKDSLTDEEYKFWLEVRNTHATINGKAVKEYTRDQMLTWYNKLHTDSSEYKMWGNGIALPTALYVLQGITDNMR